MLQGVCASECANNATVAPACIPLLTLSIPGSPTAAVLLGGLLIQGLLPGPELFTKNADITYPFIIGMFLAQFFMFGFGILASRYTHVVSNVPNYMMFGTVMILCVFGSYCVQNSFDDVLIMFSLGALMLLFKKLGIPSAPIIFLASSFGPPGRRELPAGQADRQHRRRPLAVLFQRDAESGPYRLVRPVSGICHLQRDPLCPQGQGQARQPAKGGRQCLGNSLPLWS